MARSCNQGHASPPVISAGVDNEPLATLVSGDLRPHFGPFPSWNFVPWNYHVMKDHAYEPIARWDSTVCFPKMDSKRDCRPSTQSIVRGS